MTADLRAWSYDLRMRTTVTLDPDVAAHLRRLVRERGITVDQAVNDAIRQGAALRPRTGTITRARSMGAPRADLRHALRLAAELEDRSLRDDATG